MSDDTYDANERRLAFPRALFGEVEAKPTIVRLPMLTAPGVKDYVYFKPSKVEAVTPAVLRVQQPNPLNGGRMMNREVARGTMLVVGGQQIPVALAQKEVLALLGWGTFLHPEVTPESEQG